MMKNRPNILFVFADQLSARWLPCYGNPVVTAPRLDRFAEQGVRFSRAYTNSPLCTPYRGCLLTGKYPSQTGVTENGMRLPENQETLAHLLNRAGYDTHYIGKWHLSGEPHGNRWVPPDQRGGFSRFTGWESHHVDHYDGRIWRDNPDEAIELKGHETDGLTDIVCDEISLLGGSDAPFFMTVSYQAPHAPSSPPEREYALYSSGVMDGPPSTAPDAWFRNKGWNADYGVEEFRKRYFGEITHLDAAFGRILDTLDKNGLADNTMVIFTADHGDMGGCHGLFGKGVMYDESVRVPLLIRMPGAEGGCCAECPVSTVDIFPTLLELGGATVPAGSEGTSFVSAIDGTQPNAPEQDIFIEYKDDCVIRNDLKLITSKDSDTVACCFNLAEDPYEMNNIAEQLDPGLKQEMLDALYTWRERVRQ